MKRISTPQRIALIVAAIARVRDLADNRVERPYPQYRPWVPITSIYRVLSVLSAHLTRYLAEARLTLDLQRWNYRIHEIMTK